MVTEMTNLTNNELVSLKTKSLPPFIYPQLYEDSNPCSINNLVSVDNS